MGDVALLVDPGDEVSLGSDGIGRHVLSPVSLVAEVEGGHHHEVVRLGVHIAQVVPESCRLVVVIIEPGSIGVGYSSVGLWLGLVVQFHEVALGDVHVDAEDGIASVRVAVHGDGVTVVRGDNYQGLLPPRHLDGLLHGALQLQGLHQSVQ